MKSWTVAPLRMGVPSCVLMERAALAVVDEMEKHLHRNVTETDPVRLRKWKQWRRWCRNRENPASARL